MIKEHSHARRGDISNQWSCQSSNKERGSSLCYLEASQNSQFSGSGRLIPFDDYDNLEGFSQTQLSRHCMQRYLNLWTQRRVGVVDRLVLDSHHALDAVGKLERSALMLHCQIKLSNLKKSEATTMPERPGNTLSSM